MIAVNLDPEPIDIGFDPDPRSARLMVALSAYAAELYSLAYPKQSAGEAAAGLRFVAAEACASITSTAHQGEAS
ncbi:hypothetical protein [Gordonia sp. SL306]|uniref:hypothetical protein n=1 Tax=Gordonia sp. SL306 TaxID=2995145 RepID=UPI002270AA2D|nr:hypothetical protein [Gordonia sp. SL306]WAC54267.1 hypothetical protein OVA31_16440 [Gordonia sp. SL306]